jgi:DNA-binding beta-propeller fold protein YncE
MLQSLRSAVTLALLFVAAPGNAQSSASMAPTNDLPNPYRTVEGWAKLPEGRTWGATSAVAIARDGRHIWVAERCGANNCATSALDPVLLFDTAGVLVRSFGAGLIQSPHGIHVDRDGNVWVTDCSCTLGRGFVPPTDAAPRGHQVFKFSPDGTLLLTLGAAGGARGTGFFWQPNDVVTAANGDIFVADGHSSADTANARILRFSKDGTLLATWGKRGTGPTEMDQPHALAIDSRGRLFVGDRGNDRILIFDQEGRLLDTWYQFSRPSGIFIDASDNIYVADSESGSVAPSHAAWKRGIRIGSARDGKVTAFIPDPNDNPPNTSAAEGVAVDAAGNIYGAEVGPRALKRYTRAPGR